MKRIFTLLLMTLALAVSVQGRAVFFANSIVEFKTGQEPEMVNGVKHYQQDVLWTWFDGDNVINLHDAQETDFLWSVDATGDLAIANGHFITQNGNHFEIQGSHVYFTGTKGTLTITATNPDFDGDAYSCTYTIIYHMGITSVKWDFNSKQYTIRGNWDGGETNFSGSNKYHKYNEALYNKPGEQVIAEAAGLVFSANEVGSFGGQNPEGNTPTEGRFVFLGKNASVTIPSSIFSGYSTPRVRMKAHRWGGHYCSLQITNAQDALGQYISNEYQIGGSTWWGDKGDNNYRGEYHFIINNKNNDFTITVKNNQTQALLLLSIEVYDSDEIITENSILGNTYQLLNKPGGQAGSATYYLHFRGSDEKTRIDGNSVSATGTVTCNSSNLTNMGGNDKSHTYTSTVGQFGTFRFRIDCLDRSGVYCTDYAWRTMSVGYMETRSYPYTWDFTDVNTYADAGMAQEAAYTASGSNVYSNSNSYNPVARCLWKTNNGNYELQLAADAAHNVHFCGGSQLWYGNQIIPELRYLGFTPVNYDAVYNAALTVTSEGLKFNQEIRDWWGWRITVPNVPTNGVVYVRAHKDRADEFCSVAYFYGNNITNKSEKQWFSTNYTGGTSVAREIAVTGDETGDVIYVVPAPSTQQDVTLFFTGVTVRKISVSVDPKSVSDSGWATESRNRVIDPEMTGYMTGVPFENLMVTDVNYANKTVTIEEVPSENVMMKCEGNESTKHNTYIIHNKNNESVDILNGGFHLFVPDMHDYVEGGTTGLKPALDMSNVKMVAQLGAGTVARDENGYRNFVLTNESYRLDDNGNIISGTYKKGEEAFYQVPKGGIQSGGHQGYLPVSISEGGSAPMFTFIFMGDDTTGIDETIATIGEENGETATYFNLNGQKISGVPTQRGIYIVNGKKIVKK